MIETEYGKERLFFSFVKGSRPDPKPSTTLRDKEQIKKRGSGIQDVMLNGKAFIIKKSSVMIFLIMVILMLSGFFLGLKLA